MGKIAKRVYAGSFIVYSIAVMIIVALLLQYVEIPGFQTFIILFASIIPAMLGVRLIYGCIREYKQIKSDAESKALLTGLVEWYSAVRENKRTKNSEAVIAKQDTELSDDIVDQIGIVLLFIFGIIAIWSSLASVYTLISAFSLV